MTCPREPEDLLNHGQGDHLLARYGFQSARPPEQLWNFVEARVLRKKEQKDGTRFLRKQDVGTSQEKKSGDEDEGCPGHFLMRITRPVAEGQEVFQTYGDKTNPTLFVDYGFCLQQDPSKRTANQEAPQKVAPLPFTSPRLKGLGLGV